MVLIVVPQTHTLPPLLLEAIERRQRGHYSMASRICSSQCVVSVVVAATNQDLSWSIDVDRTFFLEVSERNLPPAT
jgi:hypothetical protein